VSKLLLLLHVKPEDLVGEVAMACGGRRRRRHQPTSRGEVHGCSDDVAQVVRYGNAA